MMLTRTYVWPRYYHRILRRVPYLIDPIRGELHRRDGTGGVGLFGSVRT